MKLLLTATAALLTTVSAFAADLPSRKSANAAPVAAASSWTGVYGGLNAGYAFGGKLAVSNLDGTNPGNLNGVNGFIVGGQLGADYQIDSFVLGIAGDYDKQWASKTFHPTATETDKMSHDYVGTVRGRAGYAFSPTLLGYATGGWAFTNANVDSKGADWHVISKKALSGYVFGAGVEHKYTANISSFAEYRYYDYKKVGWTEMDARVGRSNSEVRAGVNYRF